VSDEFRKIVEKFAAFAEPGLTNRLNGRSELKKIDLQFVKGVLSELDPNLDSSDQESYLTALVVLSALAHGPETEALAGFTEPRQVSWRRFASV
jgi:hypothetical protein